MSGPMDFVSVLKACSEGKFGEAVNILETLDTPTENTSKLAKQLDQTDAKGYTCLMLASQSGHSPLVSSLLNKGARARFRSPTLNATARQLAVMAKHSGIALALAKAEMREGLFRGMVAPVMTEFDADQNLVTKNIPAYVSHLVSSGVDGVFLCGTSGESMTLSVTERKELLERWIEARNLQKAPLYIIAQIGCDSVASSVELSRHAEKCKADAVACMMPTFFKPPSVKEALQFTKKVASASPCTPFFYYHFPKITGVNIPASSWVKEAMVSIPQLMGLKFTSLDCIDYGNICAHDPNNTLALLPGFEASYTAYVPFNDATERPFGGVALMCNFLGRHLKTFVNVANDTKMPSNQKYKKLETLQRITRRVASLGAETNPIAMLKVAMHGLGICSSIVLRLPNRCISVEEVKYIENELKSIREHKDTIPNHPKQDNGRKEDCKQLK
ncbi:hypothetical protein AAMO2058_001752000 [Amorphochlora amoebiformis]|uniref:N-acetylneuraminate lyase n=1 Tax=Amorphochlora amoebiformis TaxID=1561963 RepID=A0A7S0H3T3_9EUKA